MTQKSLYFIAVVIPEPVRTEVRAFQEYTSEHFHSKAALHIPPHITLVPPFWVKDHQRVLITQALEGVCNTQEYFEVSINGFGSFGNRVIYLHVLSIAALGALAADLHKALHSKGLDVNTESRNYHPHITVAYKDLGSEVFDEAFAHFRHVQFSGTFKAENLTLLRHQHGKWHASEEFGFCRPAL
jgi:2'-5' RNA ligase